MCIICVFVIHAFNVVCLLCHAYTVVYSCLFICVFVVATVCLETADTDYQRPNSGAMLSTLFFKVMLGLNISACCSVAPLKYNIK